MPLQIAYTQTDGSVCEHMLFEGRQYRIGRSGDADITIAHPQVSRLHACLQAQNDAHWTFSDTSSTGCFAHGKAISNLMINQVYTILLGPVACQLTPWPHKTWCVWIAKGCGAKSSSPGTLCSYSNAPIVRL
ncbi:FHA domain-containing protein [Salinimonas marina]|uniref:FHA domain-containing protein n=1 Tax=Salinimonas marina TaxID=2785918 RepID=UPI001E3C5679|nr:FHA domain-containing protein [Salinimonas marina]